MKNLACIVVMMILAGCVSTTDTVSNTGASVVTTTIYGINLNSEGFLFGYCAKQKIVVDKDAVAVIDATDKSANVEMLGSDK